MVGREGLILEDVAEGTWGCEASPIYLRFNDPPCFYAFYPDMRISDQLQLIQFAVEIRCVSQALDLHYISLRDSSQKIEAIIHKLRTDDMHSGNTVGAALLIADRLTVNDKRGFGVVPQWMKSSIRISGDARRRQRDQRT